MNSEWGYVKTRRWQSKLLRPSSEASSRSVNGEIPHQLPDRKGPTSGSQLVSHKSSLQPHS